jgi:hypothetical protein
MTAKRISLTLLIVTICSISAYFWTQVYIDFYALDAPSRLDGQNHAVPIIVALDQYQQNHQQYPSELNVLVVEDYLVSIPQPNSKYSYRYVGYGNHFMLAFKEKGSADDWYCYSSTEEQWELSDSICP